MNIQALTLAILGATIIILGLSYRVQQQTISFLIEENTKNHIAINELKADMIRMWNVHPGGLRFPLIHEDREIKL